MTESANDRASSRPPLNNVHHIAFAVWDLEAAIRYYEWLLGVPVRERGHVATRGAEVAIFRLENVNLEFVAPATPESSLHQYLNERGEGFFHLAFAVNEVETAYEQLNDHGVRMAGPPYTAYKDWRIAYIEREISDRVLMHIINADAR